MYPPREGALRWRGVPRQDVAREAHGGVKCQLASRLRPLSSKATHPPNFRSLHRHNRRPNLLLDHLCTAVPSPDLVVVVQLREARASVAAVLRHDDDNHASRRGTDDVGGYTHRPDAGTHGNPTKVVPPTTAQKTTMTTSDTGPITCEVGVVKWVPCFTMAEVLGRAQPPNVPQAAPGQVVRQPALGAHPRASVLSARGPRCTSQNGACTSPYKSPPPSSPQQRVPTTRPTNQVHTSTKHTTSA